MHSYTSLSYLKLLVFLLSSTGLLLSVLDRLLLLIVQHNALVSCSRSTNSDLLWTTNSDLYLWTHNIDPHGTNVVGSLIQVRVRSSQQVRVHRSTACHEEHSSRSEPCLRILPFDFSPWDLLATIQRQAQGQAEWKPWASQKSLFDALQYINPWNK